LGLGDSIDGSKTAIIMELGIIVTVSKPFGENGGNANL